VEKAELVVVETFLEQGLDMRQVAKFISSYFYLIALWGDL
jgi:hypothetical protein